MKINFLSNIKSKITKNFASKLSVKPNNVEEAIIPSIENLRAYTQKPDNRNICKKLCIDFLKKEQPQEKVFILDNYGNIISNYTGDSEKCFFKLPDKKCLSILHGHKQISKDLTLPISFQDFYTLNKYDNISEIVAYDIKGNESILKKNADFKKISKKQFSKLEKKYQEYLISLAEDKDKKKLKKLTSYCKTHKNCDAVLSKIIDILNNLQYQPNGAIAIDKFWKDNAKFLNLYYKPY